MSLVQHLIQQLRIGLEACLILGSSFRLHDDAMILEQREGFGRRFLLLWHLQPSGQVKTKASPPVAAVAEPPALSAPPEEEKSKEAEQQQKTLRCTKSSRRVVWELQRKAFDSSARLRIDEAVKAAKELADAKFEFEVGSLNSLTLFLAYQLSLVATEPRSSAFQQEGCEMRIG